MTRSGKLVDAFLSALWIVGYALLIRIFAALRWFESRRRPAQAEKRNNTLA